MEKAAREYYLDWLRILVVALLIPHHAAITFSHIGDAYVYSPIKIHSLYYFMQSTFLNLWFMRALFFISGISTYHALKKRTNREYLFERVKRLLLPAVFAIVCICPITGYLRARNVYDFKGSLLSFYPTFFTGFVRYLGWGHFWFLAYLFVYSIILLLLRSIFTRNVAHGEQFSRPLSATRRIWFPLGVIVFFEMLFRPFFPGFQNLYADWANFTVYLTFFVFGYLLADKQENMQMIFKHMPIFLGMSCISTLLFIVLKYAQEHNSLFISYYQNMTYEYKLALALLQGIAEYSLVMLFIGIGRRYLNRNNRLLTNLSKTSFALYIFHFLILSSLLYYLIEIRINHFILFIIAICLTYIVFFLLFEFIIQRIAILRYVCGIKKNS